MTREWAQALGCCDQQYVHTVFSPNCRLTLIQPPRQPLLPRPPSISNDKSWNNQSQQGGGLLVNLYIRRARTLPQKPTHSIHSGIFIPKLMTMVGLLSTYVELYQLLKETRSTPQLTPTKQTSIY